jgi:hypothetical protein
MPRVTPIESRGEGFAVPLGARVREKQKGRFSQSVRFSRFYRFIPALRGKEIFF